MRLLVCLVLALLMTGASTAQDNGTSLDFNGLGCTEFTSQGRDGQIFAAAFLQGFRAEQGENASFSMVGARSYAQAIASACEAAPESLFLDVAQAAYGTAPPPADDAIAIETASCQAIQLMPETSGVMFGFLYGYLAERNEQSLVLDGAMQTWFGTTMDACIADPNGSLIAAARSALAP